MDELQSELKFIKQSVGLARIIEQVLRDERVPISVRIEYIDKINEIMEEK